MNVDDGKIHKVYLPFTRDQLKKHFKNVKHLEYFADSAKRHSEFIARHGSNVAKMSITKEVRLNRQIEKDERFWTVCTLKSVFDVGKFADILRMGFGYKPPIPEFIDSDECVGIQHDQELFFEVAISSPQVYRQAIKSRFLNNDAVAHLIPYVVDAGRRRTSYEGSTKVDAVFVNQRTGFSVIFEAKLTSDISCDVTFDPFRNQLARNIDVMIDGKQDSFLGSDPSKRLFALLTPRVFKEKPSTRYYGLLFHEYKRNPNTLQEHLSHRNPQLLVGVPDRLGWLSFEDCRDICPSCCPWLRPQGIR